MDIFFEKCGSISWIVPPSFSREWWQDDEFERFNFPKCIFATISFFNKKVIPSISRPHRYCCLSSPPSEFSATELQSVSFWLENDWIGSRVDIWWLSIASFVIISSGADPEGDAVIDQRLFNSSSHCWSRLFALRLLALVATLPTRQGGPGPVQFLRLYLALQPLAHRCDQYVHLLTHFRFG